MRMRRLVAVTAGGLVGRMPSAGETPERKATRTRMVLLRVRASRSEHEVRGGFCTTGTGEEWCRGQPSQRNSDED